MKRILLIVLIAALLCGCTASPAEPVVEPDMRAEMTPVSVEEDTVASLQTEAPEIEQPTEAPKTEAPETEQPVESPASDTFAKRVVAAWEAEGLLDGLAPYSDAYLLDLYGIDLSACISGAGFADAVGYTYEAVVVEADEATAAEIEQLLADHIEAMKEQFRSYDAEAYALAKQAVLVRRGGAVLMIISPEADAMRAAFDALLP